MSTSGLRVEAEPQKMSRKVSVEVQIRRSKVRQVRSLLAVRAERCAVLMQAQTPALVDISILCGFVRERGRSLQ